MKCFQSNVVVPGSPQKDWMFSSTAAETQVQEHVHVDDTGAEALNFMSTASHG